MKKGLALSGGGFRATLFHVGALWRQNEVGIMKGIDEIISISGGSIIAAYLGYKWNKLRHLFGNATLQNLPDTEDAPRFTIYATSMQSGASVRFTRDYLGEYHLGKIMNPALKLAIVVAASSAFPPPLCPVRVDVDANAWQKSDISDLHYDNYLKSTMWLVDGGVYDNLGLERIVKNCDTIMVSDAGAQFSIQRKMIYSRISQIARTKRTPQSRWQMACFHWELEYSD